MKKLFLSVQLKRKINAFMIDDINIELNLDLFTFVSSLTLEEQMFAISSSKDLIALPLPMITGKFTGNKFLSNK